MLRDGLRNSFTDASWFRTSPPKNVPQPGLTLALRPGIHAIGECPLAPAGSGNGPHFVLLALEQPGEPLEARAAKMFGDILHHDRIAQVRLVGAVLAHRFGVGNARPGRGGEGLAARELLECP